MAQTKPADHPDDVLVISHPDIKDTVGSSTRGAYDAVWKDKGFKIDSVTTRFGEGTGTEPTGYGADAAVATTAADLTAAADAGTVGGTPNPKAK